jgi:hypothetical protein
MQGEVLTARRQTNGRRLVVSLSDATRDVHFKPIKRTSRRRRRSTQASHRHPSGMPFAPGHLTLRPCADIERAQISIVRRYRACAGIERAQVSSVRRYRSCAGIERAQISIVRRYRSCADIDRAQISIEMRICRRVALPRTEGSSRRSVMATLSDGYFVVTTTLASVSMRRDDSPSRLQHHRQVDFLNDRPLAVLQGGGGQS